MHKLLIYLPNNTDPNPLCITTNTLSCVQEPEALQEAARDKEVIVIVPAEDVLLTRVKMPKLSKSRLVQALPFALEEQLVAEVDTLHFVPLHCHDEEWTIAIISKDKMQQWLTRLKEWHLKPARLLPDCLALPFAENTWHAEVRENRVIVRTGPYDGYACDRQNAAELLQIAISVSALVPEQILLENFSQQPLLADLGVPVQEQMKTEEEFLQSLAQNAEYFADVNLLQDNHFKSRNPPLKKMLIAGVVAVSAWVVLLFLYPAVSYYLLNQRLKVVNAQVAEIYHRNFPQASSVVAPRQRMEEKLHKLSGQSSGENQFLVLLGKVSDAIAQSSVGLKRLDYQNNQFNVEITAGASEDVTQFTGLLSDKGLKVNQQNATLNGSRVNATIVVE